MKSLPGDGKAFRAFSAINSLLQHTCHGFAALAQDFPLCVFVSFLLPILLWLATQLSHCPAALKTSVHLYIDCSHRPIQKQMKYKFAEFSNSEGLCTNRYFSLVFIDLGYGKETYVVMSSEVDYVKFLLSQICQIYTVCENNQLNWFQILQSVQEQMSIKAVVTEICS